MSKIIKQPGTDWIVTIRVPGDDDYPISIFGVATEDEAIEEGRKFWLHARRTEKL